MKKINRRDFLKTLGISSAAVALGSCTPKKEDDELQKGEMTYRYNERVNDKVSLLGYGCMRWPMIQVDGKDVIDQEAVNQLVDRAIEGGVNFFDSAPTYLQGQSEKATGLALSKYPRESYYISTKMSNFSNPSRENSIELYKKSLENFQTDYLDYYLLHSLGRSIENFEYRFINNGILDFLIEERKAGRIRNLGFSFHGNQEMFDYLINLHDKYHWDFVLIQLNYVDWNHASGRNTNASYLYKELEKRNIPINIMEPLLGGRLANVPDHIVERLKERAPKSTVASWAFRFAGHYPRVLTVLSGMTYMEHLEDNLKTMSPHKPLSKDELEFLEETAALITEYPLIPCNDCKYCMPCPYGIDIPAILLHYNKCVNEGCVSEDTTDPNYRKARRAYLVSYDRAVEKLRQAAHCISCNQCVEHCPQSIKIPQEIRKIDRYVEKLRQNPK